MAIPTNITTGEQSVTATGAVTGTLATSTLSGDYTVKIRVRGLTAGQGVLLSVQDTANATAFSDANNVAVHHFLGTTAPEGDTHSWKSDQIPLTRFGSTNNELRIYCQLLSGSSPTALVYGWLEQ